MTQLELASVMLLTTTLFDALGAFSSPSRNMLSVML